MNAVLLACVLGAWPELPPDLALQWPELPPIQVAGAWPELPDEHESSIEEELEKPAPTEAPAESIAWRKGKDGKLIRLPGPSVRWPHQGCLMCLGIHLERTHRIPQGKLSALGHAQWDVLHSNLHNEAAAKVAEKAVPSEPSKTAPKKAGECSGGACSSPAAVRWRRLFR